MTAQERSMEPDKCTRCGDIPQLGFTVAGGVCGHWYRSSCGRLIPPNIGMSQADACREWNSRNSLAIGRPKFKAGDKVMFRGAPAVVEYEIISYSIKNEHGWPIAQESELTACAGVGK